jgi:DNA-directed RNA polymerase specialized sigma subunit
MSDKKKIEELLRNYPYMVSNVAVEMSVDPISGVNYDKIPTQNTNEFYSTVEDYIIEKEKVSDKVIDNLNKIRAIDSVMEILLSERERKLVSEFYWQNKTLDQLSDGRYETYDYRTIRSWLDKIIEKLKKGSILKCI